MEPHTRRVSAIRTDRAPESGGGRFLVTPDLAACEERAGDDGLAAEWRVRLQDAGARLPDTGARHCAMDIAAIALADSDTSSFEAWAALLKMSASTLRNRLREEGVRGRDALAFGRVARAIIRGDPNDWRPEDVMHVMDERTLGRLVVRAGVHSGRHGARPALATLFSSRSVTLPREPRRILWQLLQAAIDPGAR